MKKTLIHQTEHQLCSAIIDAIHFSGMGWVWRVNSGVLTQQSGGKTRHIRMAQKGTSDIIGMIKTGQFVALEVKLPGKEKTITEAQKTFLEKVAANGGIASMVTSCDEALALIKSLNVYDSMK